MGFKICFKNLLQLWVRKRVCSRCKCSGGRRRRRRWRIASGATASSKSTAARCSSAKTASPPSTSASGSTEEGISLKCMLSVKPFPSLSLPTIKSTSTKLRRRKLRTFSFLTIAPFSSRIPGGTSRKSSEDPEPEPVTRNRIVNTLNKLKTRPDAFLCSFICFHVIFLARCRTNFHPYVNFAFEALSHNFLSHVEKK